jgi:hypothetical protein
VVVPKAQFTLIALICSSPAILLRDGLAMQGFVAGTVGIALAIVATNLRASELEFLRTVTRSLLTFAIVPMLWMLIQILPFGILTHPIWSSAGSALGLTSVGRISVDPGASVIGLGQYTTLVAVSLLSAAVAVDRKRAETLLFALTIAGVTSALVVLMRTWLLPKLEFAPLLRAQAGVCIAMGTIVASAACIRTFERYENRRGRSKNSLSMPLLTFALSAAAVAICASALVLDGSRKVLFATACGVAPLACVLIIRRLQLRMWGITAIAIPLTGIAVLLVAAMPSEHGRSLVLSFVDPPAASPPAMSERVLDYAPAVGTGAGTFAAIAPIYRQKDDPPPGTTAATTAANFAIELGRPMLWLLLLAILGSIVIFLKSSLVRGRDFFYPALGASCIITLLLLSFVNAGLSGTAASLTTAVILGLAIAQSKSQTQQI